MSNQSTYGRDDELNLNHETLEQWEAELQDFTLEIIERLSEIAQECSECPADPSPAGRAESEQPDGLDTSRRT